MPSTWARRSLRVSASDVITGLEQVVRGRGATHLVIGHRAIGGVRRLIDRPLADRLIERMPDVELHVVAAPTAAT